MQKLKLGKLIKTIGNNLMITHNKNGEIFKEGFNFSIKLIIYIMLFSLNLSEKEHENIYTDYSTYGIDLSKKSTYFIPKYFYLGKKIILNYMDKENNDKFIKLNFEMISKEILEYKKLNEPNLKFHYFFKIFQIYLKF